MNRRTFLASACAAAAVSTFPRRAHATGPDQNLLNTAITMNAMCTGNSFAGIQSEEAWTNLGNIHTSMYNDCMAKNLDASFIPLVNRISAGQVSTSLLNQQQATQAIESFQPSFTLADLQAYYSVLPLSTITINTALNGLRSGGLSWAYKTMAQQYHLIAYATKTAKVRTEPHLVLAGLPPHPTHRPASRDRRAIRLAAPAIAVQSMVR